MKAREMREAQADPAAVDAVLTASRSVIAVATRSLGAAAEETTIAVLVSVTPAGRQVVDCATSRRRELIADILARLPISGQRAVAHALREFAAAAGEAPDDQWPPTVPDLEGSVPRSRTPLQRAHPRLLHDGTGERP